MAKRRIFKELKDVREDPPPDWISGGPVDENDPFKWTAAIRGPSNTPYEGGEYKLDITFPQDYPFKPPKMYILNKIFHPNIRQNNGRGQVCCECVSIFGPDNWSPALTISKLLLCLCSVLVDEPNVSGCMAFPEAANLYRNDRTAFTQKAKEWTTKYAQPQNSNNTETQPIPSDNPQQENGNENENGNGIASEEDEQKAINEENGSEMNQHAATHNLCRQLLRDWDLEQYITALVEDEGYDDVEDWREITMNELKEDMQFKTGHARRFIRKRDQYFEANGSIGISIEEDLQNGSTPYI